jgi:C_GCAxxG_C_C family probable redox protein
MFLPTIKVARKKDLWVLLKHYPKEMAMYDARSEKPASRKKILDIVAKAAYDNDRAYEGCTRSVLAALQFHLQLSRSDEAYEGALRASTGLAAGIARSGETCGALVGAIMAIGLAAGTSHLADFDGYLRTMEAARNVFGKFQAHFGTVKCSEIQSRLLGRRYDFWKAEDAEAWYKEGGLDACPGVCAVAARIGAEVILDLKEGGVTE